MCRYQECNTRLTHCYDVSTYMLLLLLVMSNLLFVGNPYWFSLLRLGLKQSKIFQSSKYLSEINYNLQDWQRESRRGAHNLPSREEKYWRLLCSLK